MEKRSSNGRDSRVKVVTDELPPKTVRIILQKNIGTLKVRGIVTGNLYIFHNAGCELDVDARDLSDLLSKKRGGCCNSPASPYFALV